MGRIVEKTLLRLTHQQSLSKDWIAVIGPSIGPCCYEVDAALAHQFSKEFDPNETAEMIRPGRQDHAYLDLRKANEIQISQSGVKDVEVISKCTACATDDGNPQFFSFRRDASKERQFTAISIKTAH